MKWGRGESEEWNRQDAKGAKFWNRGGAEGAEETQSGEEEEID